MSGLAEPPLLSFEGGCPDEHTFVAMLQNEQSESGRRLLQDHLDSCARCAELVDELGRMLASNPEKQPLPRHATAGGERVGGRYELLRLVGAGGMGAVHEAYDEALGRKVAIKLLRPDLLDPELREDYSARLLREARLLAAVHHPNVLAIYDVGVWKEQVFLAIQYVEGTTISAWIEQEHPPWSSILEVYLRVGGGLAEAHHLQLVHRDIKPDNILIDPGGRAWLADFGLACAIGAGVRVQSNEGDPAGENPTQSLVTRTGSIVGTPAYMPPEQHQGLDVDERADQFSFCASLFESLSGQRAFQGRSLRELRSAVCGGPRPPRPTTERSRQVPRAVWPVLEKGLAIRPADRYAHMGDLLAALSKAAAQKPLRKRLLRAFGWALGLFTLSSLMAVGLLFLTVALWPTSNPTPDPAKSAKRRTKSKEAIAAEEKAKQLAKLEDLNQQCKQTPEGCDALVTELHRCCVSESWEGVDYAEGFRTGTKELGDRLEAACERNPSACAIAAYAWSRTFHDDDAPEGKMIPHYMTLVEKGCRKGDFLSCVAIRDAYSNGSLQKEAPPFAIKPSSARLEAILSEGCAAGNGHVCWLLSESFFSSRQIEKNNEKALRYMTQSCEHGWTMGCLLGGMQWRNLGQEQCQEEVRSFFQQIPDNDVLDSSANWNDVVAFCKRSAPFKDEQKAKALWARGCGLPDTLRDASLTRPSKHTRHTSQLCCELAQRVDPAFQPPAPSGSAPPPP